MADKLHLAKLCEGVDAWNSWRKEHPNVKPDLLKAKLSYYTLSSANLTYAHLAHAHLDGVDLSNANLFNAHLYDADLSNANLFNANFYRADLSNANLKGADLQGADLRQASLVQTKVENATLTGCKVHGISVWNLKGVPAQQNDLLMTRNYPPFNEPTITVDNLEVAQFLSLLIEYEKLDHVIDAITTKIVLILGRFTKERKAVLDNIRKELRTTFNYIPILFDHDRPQSKIHVETVITIANMAHFVIADFTDAKRVLEEVPKIVEVSGVPIQPLMQVLPDGKQTEDTTVAGLRVSHTTILPTCFYTSKEELLASLKECVIDPAERKAEEMQQARRQHLGPIDDDIKRKKRLTYR
jgi:uncharacterized protein YjbI with pentapeptide repeats